ncbi:MAG: hypothetical protein ACRYFS_21910 [Janthinobacterium lividum]
MQFSPVQFPRTIVSRTTILGLALAGLGALTALPASAQITVTSASRNSTAYGEFPFGDGTVSDSTTANGVFSASDTRYLDGSNDGIGVSTATQSSNISTVPTLLSVSGFGTSSLDSQFFSGNPYSMAADSQVNVTFTLDQTTPFALFGSTSVSAGGGSAASFTLTDQTSNSTVFSSAPNAAFQDSGSLLAGTYSLVADTNSSGGVQTSNGSFNFAFDAGPVAVAAVPEASTTVSFGLLLALGMGGVVIAAKKKKAASQAS